jgi:hypothetical protein
VSRHVVGNVLKSGGTVRPYKTSHLPSPTVFSFNDKATAKKAHSARRCTAGAFCRSGKKCPTGMHSGITCQRKLTMSTTIPVSPRHQTPWRLPRYAPLTANNESNEHVNQPAPFAALMAWSTPQDCAQTRCGFHKPARKCPPIHALIEGQGGLVRLQQYPKHPHVFRDHVILPLPTHSKRLHYRWPAAAASRRCPWLIFLLHGEE